MPIWLRKFYYKKIQEALTEKKKAQEDSAKNIKKPKVTRPAIKR
jgi:hypothetical protein